MKVVSFRGVLAVLAIMIFFTDEIDTVLLYMFAK